eukprot:3152496-Alexandrium_andersonii.AAC.1
MRTHSVASHGASAFACWRLVWVAFRLPPLRAACRFAGFGSPGGSACLPARLDAVCVYRVVSVRSFGFRAVALLH